jgi:uncharacterized protein
MTGRPEKINKPIWIDLATTDTEGAQGFYSQLFGWEKQDLGPEAQGYAFWNLNGEMVAGFGPTQMPDQPTAWQVSIGTEDVEATLAKVKESGGDIIVGATDVFDTGRWGVFRDPTGATLGLWQPLTMSGFRVENQPGSFTWAELNTPDLETSKRFYGTLFGWTTKTSEGDQPYTEWQIDGQSIGGAWQTGEQISADTPPSWLVYFATDDVDQTASKATDLGGKVLTGPQDYPGGRFAIIQDPQGGVPFGVVKSQQQ